MQTLQTAIKPTTTASEEAAWCSAEKSSSFAYRKAKRSHTKRPIKSSIVRMVALSLKPYKSRTTAMKTKTPDTRKRPSTEEEANQSSAKMNAKIVNAPAVEAEKPGISENRSRDAQNAALRDVSKLKPQLNRADSIARQEAQATSTAYQDAQNAALVGEKAGKVTGQLKNAEGNARRDSQKAATIKRGADTGLESTSILMEAST